MIDDFATRILSFEPRILPPRFGRARPNFAFIRLAPHRAPPRPAFLPRSNTTPPGLAHEFRTYYWPVIGREIDARCRQYISHLMMMTLPSNTPSASVLYAAHQFRPRLAPMRCRLVCFACHASRRRRRHCLMTRNSLLPPSHLAPRENRFAEAQSILGLGVMH